MKAIGKLPDDLPSISDEIGTRPTSWLGRPIEWCNDRKPVLVFIERFVIPDTDFERQLFLFGARYEVAEMKLDGKSLGAGNFIEYFVIERVANCQPTIHRLAQRGSVTFSEIDEKKDYLPASKIKDPNEFSMAGKPVWEESEAVWPTMHGEPMIFVGQVALPENEITRKLLTWNKVVYLFWRWLEGRSRFKIVIQDTEFQSAEAHYSQEE